MVNAEWVITGRKSVNGGKDGVKKDGSKRDGRIRKENNSISFGKVL